MIRFGQGADDSAVYSDVGGVGWIGSVNENITGMHIGMEKAVPQDLGEKYFYTPFCQQLEVHFFLAQYLHIGDWYAVNPFHGEHFAPGIIPVDLGDVNQLAVFEIPAQL